MNINIFKNYQKNAKKKKGTKFIQKRRKNRLNSKSICKKIGNYHFKAIVVFIAKEEAMLLKRN
jgi:hypothetical protein